MSDESFWSSFECYCSEGGIVFDVRSDDEPMETASCPRCRRVLETRGFWEADPNGYGSRGDTQGERDLLREAIKRSDAEIDALRERITFARATLEIATRVVARAINERDVLDVVRQAIKSLG